MQESEGDFEDAVLKLIGREYGLEECSAHLKMNRKTKQIQYKIIAPMGLKFYLKEKPHYITDEHFDFHLKLHRYICRKQGPVTTILMTNSGRLWIRLGERKFELQEWIEGRPIIHPTYRDLEKMGELLALLHNSMKGFRSEKNEKWDFPPNRSYLCPERWFEISDYMKFLLNPFNIIGENGTGSVETIRQFLENKGRLIVLPNLPQQYVHGDFDRLNCIKGTSGRILAVDLDLAHWGCRLSDLAFAVAKICGMEISNPLCYHIREKWQSSMAKKLVSGYESISSLSNYERECLDLMLALNLIRAFISCLDLDMKNPMVPNDLGEQIDMLGNMLHRLT